MSQIIHNGYGKRLPFPLQVERIKDDWEVLRDFVYKARNGKTVTVKSGFHTDLGTIPALFRSFLSVDAWAEAFVVHDWGLVKRQWDNGDGMSIKEADGLLKEVAIYTGHSRWRVYPVYWAVRAHSKLVKRWQDEHSN